MTSQPIGSNASAAAISSYAEKLRTPWWWYLGAISVALLLGGEFAFAVSGWITWVPLLVLVPVCLATVWRLSAANVVIADGQLRVPERTLDLSRVERAIKLSPTELRRLVGRHSDPTAFVFIRSWVGPGVQLVLTESGRVQTDASVARASSAEHPPEDGLGDYDGSADDEIHVVHEVPYWVVSTRRPDEFMSTLRSAGVITF